MNVLRGYLVPFVKKLFLILNATATKEKFQAYKTDWFFKSHSLWFIIVFPNIACFKVSRPKYDFHAKIVIKDISNEIRK